MDAQNWKIQISAYVDGELTAEEIVAVEKLIAERPEVRAYLNELRGLSSKLQSYKDEPLSPDSQHHILSKATKESSMKPSAKKVAGAVCVLALIMVVVIPMYTQKALQVRSRDAAPYFISQAPVEGRLKSASDDIGDQFSPGNTSVLKARVKDASQYMTTSTSSAIGNTQQYEPYYQKTDYSITRDTTTNKRLARDTVAFDSYPSRLRTGNETTAYEPEKVVYLANSGVAQVQDQIQASIPSAPQPLIDGDYRRSGDKKNMEKAISFPLESVKSGALMTGAMGYGKAKQEYNSNYTALKSVIVNSSQEYWGNDSNADALRYDRPEPANTDEYSKLEDNQFLKAQDNPLSTFSIDVDTASYSNVRRYLQQNQMPPADAVRVEEMVNYFSYDYPKPTGKDPFSVTTNVAVCPWNKTHQLLHIGLKGRSLEGENAPPSQLTFLIDVSGSMAPEDRLPLLRDSFKMMVNQLRPQDRVAIVVYAGSAGLVLPPTSGADKGTIMAALDHLQAGGSTAGGAGIQLAYDIAQSNFITNGNNRVILATDGDFNVGVSSTSELTRMIEEKRQAGVFLTILGFGQGNLKDSRMQELADKGNGNYYYIDNLKEGRKVLVSELGSTLFTIAKDVKIQIEFNPGVVQAYRLVGYESRMLAKEDFNNDQKDAGEIGAGHTVTALYEIIPIGVDGAGVGSVDALKYQKAHKISNQEMMTLKLRYKEPNEDVSKLITKTVKKSDIKDEPTGDFAWAASVAEFGMLLHQSPYKANASYSHVLRAARANTGDDRFGLKQEFLELVQTAENQAPSQGGIQYK